MNHWDPSSMIDGDTDWPCPQATLIAPCVCTSTGSPNYNFDIDCSAATQDTDISNAFAILFPFDDINQLQIEGSDSTNKVPITNFTQNMFDSKSFSLIKIDYTSLETIEENVFQLSHDSLASMSLERNNLQLFPFEIISEYTILTFIHMPSNDILELPKVESLSLRDINLNHNKNLVLMDGALTFVGAPLLRTIRLSDTAITQIPPNLFNSLTQVTNIYLGDNVIPELEANSINAPGPTIMNLDLSGSSISTVRVGAISGMAEDGTIDLSDNQITTLEEDVWRPILDQLTGEGALILDGNLLTCDCDINWIMINDDIKKKLSPDSACYTGDLIAELDDHFFLTNCEQPTTTESPQDP